MPLVSIILPNYNHKDYLKKRFDSILNQTFQDFELIILDDCSTDNSRHILNQYKDHPCVTYFEINENNSGSPFLQWKKGIEKANGTWIWIAESDDYCSNNLLARLLENALRHSAVLSYCQSIVVDDNGKEFSNMLWWTDDLDKNRWLRDYVNNGDDEIRSYLLFKNTIPNASAVLFKKSAYLLCESFFQQMKLCGDWMLWVNILKQGNISYCADALNYFRRHDYTTRILNSSIKKKLRYEEEFMVARFIYRNIKSFNEYNFKKRLSQIISCYSSFLNMKEVIKHLLLPYTYNGIIPFYKVIGHYFMIKLRLVKVKE